LAPRQRELLSEYLDLFLHSAQLFNLTAIRDRAEAWDRHVIESLRLLPLLGPGTSLIDVGSGGGLPGMVLAIARPDLAVTLLEATGKKARFLEQTGRTLALENLTVLCQRAESAGAAKSAHRERFDIVTARAVAPLRVLLELTVPFARPGGLVLAVKGEKAADELVAAASALRELHVAHEQTVRQPTASVVLLRKRAATSAKYPRRAGEPTRSPL
jgi:16S rRNA (guanine527-N7)-methyltransferase